MEYDPINDLTTTLEISIDVFNDAAIAFYRSIMATLALPGTMTYFSYQKFVISPNEKTPELDLIPDAFTNSLFIDEAYIEAQIDAMELLIKGLAPHIEHPGDATEKEVYDAKAAVRKANEAIETYRKRIKFARRVWTKSNPDMQTNN